MTRLQLWLGFVAVHGMLSLLGLSAPGWPLGDVQSVYPAWLEQAQSGIARPGIDSAWVYPILAFLPLTAAGALPMRYDFAWLLMVTLLNAAAFALLLGRGQLARARAIAAAWWLVFLFALGPIALGRIDSVTVPLALAALLWALGRPVLASALLVTAAWMKVWTGVLWVALLVARRSRRAVLLAAVAVSGVVIAGALAAGAGGNVLSFVSEQGNRGLQVEAIAALPFVWRIALGSADYRIAYSTEMLTFQVYGPGVQEVASVLTPLLLVLVTVVTALAVWLRSRGASVARELPALALALTIVLILSNKVGSPQFVTWLAPAVVLGLVLDRKSWRLIAVLSVLIAALTQVMYPYWYSFVLSAEPGMVLVMTVRALLEVGVLAAATALLWRAGSRSRAISRARTLS